MPQQYVYEHYRYRKEWRVRRYPVRVISLSAPWKIEKTGPYEIVETGLWLSQAIFLTAKLREQHGLLKEDKA